MTTTTPDMGLVLPDVSVTAGPQWATLLNNALTVIDSHDHSTGKGVQIQPAGINISGDLTFNSNNATNLRSLRLFNNTSFTAGSNDLTCLYALNNELYYRDGAGNTIQFTSGGFLDVSANINNLTIKDTSFFLENFSDTTKQMRFNVSAIPTGTTRILSVPDSGANDTFVTQAATQTLTNKTLSGNTAATLINGSGTLTLNTTGNVTLPNVTDTVVTQAATQTLTNKTLSGNISSNFVNGAATITLPTSTSTLATTSLVETLSNKSFNSTVTILGDNQLQFNNSGNTFYTTLKAGSNTANANFILPIADGTPNQILQTNGSGQLSFVSNAGSTQATQTVLGVVKGGTVPGTNTGTATGAGYIGEVISSTAANQSSTSSVYLTPNNVSLTAGIWRIKAWAYQYGTSGLSAIRIGISTDSNTTTFSDLASPSSPGLANVLTTYVNSGAEDWQTEINTVVNLSTTTTYYLKYMAVGANSSNGIGTSLNATRIG